MFHTHDTCDKICDYINKYIICTCTTLHMTITLKYLCSMYNHSYNIGTGSNSFIFCQ